MIVGHQAELVQESTASYDVEYVMQHEQLGTGTCRMPSSLLLT